MASSIFLEGLITARDLVKEKGIEALEALILEQQSGAFEIETAAIEYVRETRSAWE